MPTTLPVDVNPANLQMYLGTCWDMCFEELGRHPALSNPDDQVVSIMLDQMLRGGTAETVRAWLRSTPEWAAHHAHVDPSSVSEATLRAFKGNFGSIHIPDLPYGPNHVLFTPGYVCYDDQWRRRIRDEYKARGYTHFPISLFPGPIYYDFYPAWDQSRINDFLRELWDDGLIPVCYDHSDDNVQAPGVDPSLVRIVVPMWEMNGPLSQLDEPQADQSFSGPITECIKRTRARYPDALCYIHFAPLHGAGGEPEGPWWHWAKWLGVAGSLYDCNTDAQSAFDRAADFLVRFKGYHGWPSGLDLVLHETTAYQAFHDGWSEAQSDAYNSDILRRSPAVLVEGGVDYTNGFAGYTSGRQR